MALEKCGVVLRWKTLLVEVVRNPGVENGGKHTHIHNIEVKLQTETPLLHVPVDSTGLLK